MILPQEVPVYEKVFCRLLYKFNKKRLLKKKKIIIIIIWIIDGRYIIYIYILFKVRFIIPVEKKTPNGNMISINDTNDYVYGGRNIKKIKINILKN